MAQLLRWGDIDPSLLLSHASRSRDTPATFFGCQIKCARGGTLRGTSFPPSSCESIVSWREAFSFAFSICTWIKEVKIFYLSMIKFQSLQYISTVTMRDPSSKYLKFNCNRCPRGPNRVWWNYNFVVGGNFTYFLLIVCH